MAQSTMQHQLMGYDKNITMFSPDGRLLQVEYAKMTVSQGTTAMGFVGKDGVVLITDKRLIDSFIVPETVEKIFQVDDHIGITASGLISDARVLVEDAQVKAQQHKLTFNSSIDTISIVKQICNYKQICTQSGGLRPFGVSLIVAGVDSSGPVLYLTDPTGIYFQYRVAVIGEFEEDVKKFLSKEYKSSMSVKELARLGVKALQQVLGKNFNADRVEGAFIDSSSKLFKRFSRADIGGFVNGSRKR